jgi:hypothetical protein
VLPPSCQWIEIAFDVCSKYLENPENWNAWFTNTVAKIDDPAGRLIRLKPDTTFTNNVSYFKTGPELAWPEE